MLPVQPIGVFDSGVGGLTIAEEISRQLPFEKIIYFGDTAHVPYGPRSVEELTSFADKIVDFLIRHEVKAIVDACNTTSAVALPFLQEKYDIPIIGVIEPGVMDAMRVTKNRHIGIIATEATIASHAHQKAIESRGSNYRVFNQACPKFVPLVEDGKVYGPEVRSAVEEYLLPLLKANIDTLILGCTHYPFLRRVIKEVAGPEVTLVDPAVATVRELKKVLIKEKGLRGPHTHTLRSLEFYVSGDPDSFSEVGYKLVGWPELDNTRKVEVFNGGNKGGQDFD
ncbi:MAG: glutamate racemase [Clostridia bacterium]|nr:glutamate racemase [Clostridia bacterium]